jgi:hypothetical protein
VTSVLPYFLNLVINTLKSYKNTVDFSLKIRLLVRPSILPKFVDFASLPQKEIGDRQNKKRDRHKHKKRSATDTNYVMAFVDCTHQQCAINVRHDTIRHQESEASKSDE